MDFGWEGQKDFLYEMTDTQNMGYTENQMLKSPFQYSCISRSSESIVA